MSKKPLLSEGTARRWAKYAGIQNESKALLSEMYDKMEEEEDYTEEEEPVEEAMGADDEGEGLEEADNVLAELEAMLAEQDDEEELEDDELEDEDEMDDEDMDDEDMEDEEEMDMEDEEADEEAAGGMDQQAVEDAVKAGLEAMASAIGDALKIKIDVRSGEEIEPEPEAEAGEGGEEEIMEMGDYNPAVEEAAADGLYEGINRDELVERVMKRVAARLVRESKQK